MNRSCPCSVLQQCDPSCFCVDSFSSYGCSMCVSYGSLDQRMIRANQLFNKKVYILTTFIEVRYIEGVFSSPEAAMKSWENHTGTWIKNDETFWYHSEPHVMAEINEWEIH